MSQELTEMDLQIWKRAKSPQVNLLASGCIGIVRPCVNMGGKVSNLEDVMARQKAFADFRRIYPFERSVFQSAVIEIKTVDVNKCAQ